MKCLTAVVSSRLRDEHQQRRAVWVDQHHLQPFWWNNLPVWRVRVLCCTAARNNCKVQREYISVSKCGHNMKYTLATKEMYSEPGVHTYKYQLVVSGLSLIFSFGGCFADHIIYTLCISAATTRRTRNGSHLFSKVVLVFLCPSSFLMFCSL